MTALHLVEAVAAVVDRLSPADLVVAANGHISRACHAHGHRPGNFYMLGSMGLAPAIGLGVALAQPGRRVVVLDGDGNALMGLGTTTMIGAWRPGRLLHVVLDNGTYASTGGQPTLSPVVDWPALAAATGYRGAWRVTDAADAGAAVERALAAPGPVLLHVAVDNGDRPPSPRVGLGPEEIAAGTAALLRTAS